MVFHNSTDTGFYSCFIGVIPDYLAHLLGNGFAQMRPAPMVFIKFSFSIVEMTKPQKERR